MPTATSPRNSWSPAPTPGDITTIHLKDPVYALRVDLKYKTYPDVDMIEAWTEVSHQEKGVVTLTTFASACCPSVAATCG
jgi:hypothetical protein